MARNTVLTLDGGRNRCVGQFCEALVEPSCLGECFDVLVACFEHIGIVRQCPGKQRGMTVSVGIGRKQSLNLIVCNFRGDVLHEHTISSDGIYKEGLLLRHKMQFCLSVL
jgi:hypothetical protein